jgi:predicted secreted protein with PEFG-CTERM motif
MQKMEVFVIIGIVCIIGFAGYGLSLAFAMSYNFDDCGFENCFVYLPTENTDVPNLQINPNWMIDVIMPDGTCNITGILQTNGSCSSPSLILSNDNFTAFKNNVAVMTVVFHKTNIIHTDPYCPLAEFSWNHQDGYAYKTVNLKQYVIPSYCNPIVVPEFGPVASLVLVIAIVSVVAVTAKSRA